MGPRHKNKLLAGAKVLISTESSFRIPEIKERKSLLDILIHWEMKSQIGAFLDTHLSYIGPMSTTVLHTIMENTRLRIQEGNCRTMPFNTSAFRVHVGGSSRKRNLSTSPKKEPNLFQKEETWFCEEQ